MGIFRQENWTGLPFPPLGDLPDPGIELYLLCLLHWQADSSPAEPLGKPLLESTSVQFSRSIMSDSLRPHGLQHTRPPCPSPIPRVSQMHVHWVDDAIQPSLPLLSPSPPAFNLSKCQGLSQWVSSSHQVAKVQEFQLQHQYLQWIFRTDLP